MEILWSILKWIFVDTIYGIIGVAALVYVIVSRIRIHFPKVPDPAFIAVPIAVIGLLTIPSIPRYTFERNLLTVTGKPWVRVVKKTKWGDLTQPLTLIWTPVGYAKVVMPNSPITGGFREIVYRYDEEPMVSMADIDCSGLTIMYSRPDKSGTFRYVTRSPQPMSPGERDVYCNYDWGKEKAALRSEMLRGFEGTQ